MIGIMTKQGFGKKNVAEIVDRFKATFGDVPCTAYEVYCGIGEILFLAQSKGVSGRSMVELEEKVAKCLSMKWREYDIPGEVCILRAAAADRREVEWKQNGMGRP